MCLFLQNPNDPNATVKLTVPELRPHIEFAYKQKLKRVTFDHRYRAEARFFHKTNLLRTQLDDGFGFGNFRFRYKLQVTIPLYKVANNRYLKLILSNEIHLNAGKNIKTNVFDQNRLGALLGYRFNKNVRIEAGYISQILQFGRKINGQNVFQNNSGLIVNANFNFDLTKKPK